MYQVSQPEKLDYLLGLRGLAALGVLLGHAFAIGPYSLGVYISSSPTATYAIIDHPLDSFRAALFTVTPILGTNFVILFFVQSGYLMGKIFYDRRYDNTPASVARFYRNRYFRLAPLLYFNLLVAICFFDNVNFSPLKFLGDITFTTNFTDPGINLVTWSLSHEMQYYLLAPFVFYFFRPVNTVTLLKISACIGAVYLLTRQGFFHHFEYLYSFLVGYSVNILIRLWPRTVSERTKIVTILCGVAAINVAFNYLVLRGFSELASIAVALLSAALVFVAECPSQHEVSLLHPVVARIVRGAVFTGTLSYGIYLWHYMIIMSRFSLFTRIDDTMAIRFGWSSLWQKILFYHAIELSFTLVAAYLMAIITFYLIEVRFRPGLYARAGRSTAVGVDVQDQAV